MKPNRWLVLAVGLSCVQVTAGQSFPGVAGFNMEVIGGVVSPVNPIVTIRVSATYSAQDFAFGAALFDVVADEPGWSNPMVLMPLPRQDGTVEGPRVREIVAGQIHFPPLVTANSANPITVWQASWSPSHFRPRDVQVQTVTRRFDVYIDPTGPAAQSRLATMVEGRAVIQIVPSPASILPILAGAVLCVRQRRNFAT